MSEPSASEIGNKFNLTPMVDNMKKLVAKEKTKVVRTVAAGLLMVAIFASAHEVSGAGGTITPEPPKPVATKVAPKTDEVKPANVVQSPTKTVAERTLQDDVDDSMKFFTEHKSEEDKRNKIGMIASMMAVASGAGLATLKVLDKFGVLKMVGIDFSKLRKNSDIFKQNAEYRYGDEKDKE